MDTERDENQNLRNVFDERQNTSQSNNSTEDIADQILNDTEFERAENDDFLDDQNNSSTGYTEKLLEIESEEVQNENKSDSENHNIENDLVVLNGNIAEDDISDENDSNYNENSNDKDSGNKSDYQSE